MSDNAPTPTSLMETMTAPTANRRLDYLDAVRAFALLLGIVFHASLSFTPIYIGWAVMDISTSPTILGFMLVSHSFRMPLFFLIAGFFSHYSYHRRGAGAFYKSRLVRIAIPFVIGWFILWPLIISGWVMGAESLRGDVDILNGLKTGFQSLENLPAGLLTGTHLWFLYYLLLITGLTVLARTAVGLLPTLGGKATTWADRAVGWAAHSHLSWLVLALPTAACIWQMNAVGLDTPDKSLAPNWPVLTVYGGFFTFGWLLHRQTGLIEQFARLSWSRAAVGIISIGVTLQLSGYQTNMGHPHIELIRAGFALSYALMMWSLISISIGLFKRLLDRPSKIVRYMADASYWLYLIHLPIVVWLQIAFAEVPLHWSLKLPAVSLLTIGISLVLYDLIVRSTLIGKTLNGRRKERVLTAFLAGNGKRPPNGLPLPEPR